MRFEDEQGYLSGRSLSPSWSRPNPAALQFRKREGCGGWAATVSICVYKTNMIEVMLAQCRPRRILASQAGTGVAPRREACALAWAGAYTSNEVPQRKLRQEGTAAG